MKKLELQKCIVGSVYTNCYFLKNKENGELLIVDPGDACLLYTSPSPRDS